MDFKISQVSPFELWGRRMIEHWVCGFAVLQYLSVEKFCNFLCVYAR